MANQKHLTQDDRFKINTMLEQGESFRAIGRELDKDCTTISKEIRSHLVYEKTGCMGKAYNSCVHRFNCDTVLSAAHAPQDAVPISATFVNYVIPSVRIINRSTVQNLNGLLMSAMDVRI